VDDCSEILYYLHRLLMHWGHEVLALRCDGQTGATEVLEHVRFIKFEAVVVGLMMPGMNGLNAAVWINRLSPSTKVIITVEPVPPEEVDWLRRRELRLNNCPRHSRKKNYSIS
jgi:CheY-like chemotaxis protein